MEPMTAAGTRLYARRLAPRGPHQDLTQANDLSQLPHAPSSCNPASLAIRRGRASVNQNGEDVMTKKLLLSVSMLGLAGSSLMSAAPPISAQTFLGTPAP